MKTCEGKLRPYSGTTVCVECPRCKARYWVADGAAVGQTCGGASDVVQSTRWRREETEAAIYEYCEEREQEEDTNPFYDEPRLNPKAMYERWLERDEATCMGLTPDPDDEGDGYDHVYGELEEEDEDYDHDDDDEWPDGVDDDDDDDDDGWA